MGDAAAEILVADSDWRESDILDALSDAPANEDHRDDDDEIDARDGRDSAGTDSTMGEGGVVGSSTLSRSPSIGASSSSVDGKKLRKRSSACHFDAFRNSTQTSIRPGRESAGSRRSR